MRGFICAIILFIFFHQTGHSQSYGLRFSSHEVVQEKRTSLDLSPSENICFSGDGAISFDLMLARDMEVYFGYVFRMITADKQNIDLIYNQKLSNFNLIIGETPSGSFTIDSPRLYNKWNRIDIRFNLSVGQILLYVNNKYIGKSKIPLKAPLCFKMSMGTSSSEEFQTADIPPMSIKDLRISDRGKVKYDWPLSESSGEECFDSVQGKMARVVNPIWIRPQHQNWQLANVFWVDGTPGIAFDPIGENLYAVSEDSLYTMSVQKGQWKSERLSPVNASMPPGNQSIFSPVTGKLYDFNIDEKKVKTFDSTGRKWDSDYRPGPLTEFWQANKFISSVDTSLYIIGGYGQLHYKNMVQRYHFADRKWEAIPTTGDHFTPRYLAGLGISRNGDTAYIAGGYGSNTGDQMVNPKYNYDLLEYIVKDRSFKVIYHLKEPDQQFCFANSLVIDSASRSYYGLIFPNDKFNSALRLIKGSLQEPEYELVGDTIPYSFHDVKSFADLYYAPSSKKLVAVTMYTDQENRTEIRVYTIAFPPNPIVAVSFVVVKSFSWRYIVFLLIAVAAGFILLWRIKASRKAEPAQAAAPAIDPPHSAPVVPYHPHPAPVVVKDDRSVIYFFGQFEVYDREGNDLSKSFTPLLKELFLLIAIYTLRSGKGISSEKLYSTLWRDKSNKDAQNNRSVNMVKLKGILDKLGTCAVVKEADKWIVHYAQDQIRVDLAEFLALVQTSQPEKEDIRHLLTIIHRGTFLADTVYPWLDDIQSEVSDKALDMLSAACLQFSTDTEFLLEIAGGIFLFDPVNEDALRIKCKSLGLLGRHSTAKSTFEKFAKEYHQMYGEEFQYSFHEILSN